MSKWQMLGSTISTNIARGMINNITIPIRKRAWYNGCTPTNAISDIVSVNPRITGVMDNPNEYLKTIHELHHLFNGSHNTYDLYRIFESLTPSSRYWANWAGRHCCLGGDWWLAWCCVWVALSIWTCKIVTISVKKNYYYQYYYMWQSLVKALTRLFKTQSCIEYIMNTALLWWQKK